MKKAAEATSFRRAARRKKSCKAGLLSFLCIDIYVIEKEDSNERNPSGVSFVFVQVGLAENEVFCRAEKRRKHSLRRKAPRALPVDVFVWNSQRIRKAFKRE